jgi:acyl carrier protein|tara:strand:+ start:220 stop:483 length:264 start_codon:yes stop_codon:yes gene_type:complete
MQTSHDKALEIIKSALDNVQDGLSEKVTAKSDLTKDSILDSLDAMNFLFELQTLLNSSLPEIGDGFSDYRMSTLIEIVEKHINSNLS